MFSVKTPFSTKSFLRKCRFPPNVGSLLDFKSGVEHHLNVTLTSDPSKVKIDIGGEVTSWN